MAAGKHLLYKDRNKMADINPLNPLDYSMAFNPPNPAGNLLNSYNTGFMTAIQQQQVQAQMQTQKQMQADATALAANPSTQAIAQFSLKYPQLSEASKRNYDMMTTEEQNAKLKQAIPIYAALAGGNPGVASDLLSKQADAYQNAGRDADAVSARTMSQLAKDHPEFAYKSFGILLSGLMGAPQFNETFKTINEQARANAKAPYEVSKLSGEAAEAVAKGNAAPETVAMQNANIGSEITNRVGRLALDRDKLATETELKKEELRLQHGTPQGKSLDLLNESAAKSVEASQMADHVEKLATTYENMGSGDYSSGISGRLSESWKNFFGDQDSRSNVKAEYTRTRSQISAQALAAAKLTPVSDNDVKTFTQGFPENDASPQHIASFLRGWAKTQRVLQLTEEAKSSWVAANRHLGRATNNMEIDGVRVPKGMSLPVFTNQYIEKALPRFLKTQSTNAVYASPYAKEMGLRQQQQTSDSRIPYEP
jgi:hypothetical protein